MSELQALRTQLGKAKAEMDAALVAAEQATDAKQAFLANMSHEIRTPITAIVGYADMLLEAEQSPAERQECVQTIRRNARHLLELINDLLDLASLEAGRLRSEPEQCNLPHVASEIMSLMRPRALEKKLQLELFFDGGVPRFVVTDMLRLKQVLINLVGNAIKFTPQGGIVLRVVCVADTEGQWLDFEVSDTGVGMSAEQVAVLFRPFGQGDNSLTRRFGGTGLGLALCQRCAELLGGRVTVRSELGKGSIFCLRVPSGNLAGSEMLHGVCESIVPIPAEALSASPIQLHGRILLAEDGADNQRLIATLLRKAGADVAVVGNGRLAVERASREPFDLILMDMQMPELDGYDATRQLRASGMRLPIIALTAHAMKGDREKCLQAGCSEYLTKPIDKQHFLATVGGFLGPAVQALEPLRSRFAGDPDMKEVVEEFVRELPRQVVQLQSLLEQENLEGLRVAAHQLKGAGGGYGFDALTESAALTERAIKENASLAVVTADVQRLMDLIRRVDSYDEKREEHDSLK